METHARIVTALELLLFFLVPVGWAAGGLIPHEARHVVLQLFIALLILLVVHRRLPRQELGFSRATFLPALRALAPGTLLALLGVVVLYQLRIGTGSFFQGWWHNHFFLYYIAIGAPSQEFAYRSFLLPTLTTLTKRRWVVVAAGAAFFATLHVFHHNPFTWVAVLLFGLYLNWVFLRHPNFFASWIAHAVVGTVAIILGFFSSSSAPLLY